MMSRAILPVGVLAITLPVVKAASSNSDCTAKKRLKPSQLSLYGEPASPKLVYIPAKENEYTKLVAKVRKSVWETCAGMQGSIESTKLAVRLCKDYLRDAKRHVQEDSSGLQRAGLITVAGFGGIVAGYKGGMFRKAVLGSAAMTTAAAVCYPNQAVEISSIGLTALKRDALLLWEKMQTAGTHKMAPPVTPNTESKDGRLTCDVDTKPSSEPPCEDPGQSKPEDKDLYASRS